MPSNRDRPSRSQPRVLIVQNSEQGGPRRFQQWLEDAGVDIDTVCGWEGLPETLTNYEGYIMLGGGLLPNAYDEAPWLRQEGELARQAVQQQVPTLGICLGGQILAHIGGGEVRARYGEREAGPTVISLTEAGRKDPVVGAIGTEAPLIENHEDQMTRIPDGAVHLARSAAVENQAFRIGECVWGLQFHPETGAEHLTGWDESAFRDEGIDLRELQDLAKRTDADTTRASRALAEAFAEQVKIYANKKLTRAM
jgi:GMP synthase (glutamine-hydrolysing)